MKRVTDIRGNVHTDETLSRRQAAHADAGTLERVVLEAADRKKSRLRVETDAGTDLGIVVDKPALKAGDVLICEDECMVVVAFEPRMALTLELPAPTPETMARAVELGHRVGNQHWELAVADGVVYIPLEADRHIVERLVGAVFPDGTYTLEEVDATLFLSGVAGVEYDHDHDH